MIDCTRRSFVKGTLALGATAAFAAPSKGPHWNFPTDPRARIGVATYPFRAFMTAPGNHDRDAKKPGMDLVAFASFVHKEFGVPGIEPLSTHFPSSELDEVKKLRAAFDAAGVHTINVPVDERVDLCSEDEAKRAHGNERYRRWVDIAVILGSPSVRVWIPKCSDTSDMPKAVKALKPTVDYAATRNIVVNLENDDPVYSSAARSLAAIRLADTPWLRALPDFGNGLAGGDERFNADSVRGMFAHAWNISHVKDALADNGKVKTASITELYGIAKASGYRGYYSMESDSNVDPVVDTKHLIAESLRLM
jgi:sugar phosphate isomerase/epimerase